MNPANKFVAFVPSLLTLMNLVCGSIAIILVFPKTPGLQAASYFVFAAAIFDFVDGWAARKLNATSAFGKELDSLADVVSFGVAPAIIMFELLRMSLTARDAHFNFETAGFLSLAILFSPLLITLFSAIRLAKFNIDDTQKNSFRGLPTPANALFLASLAYMFIETDSNALSSAVLNLYFLLGCVGVLSYLLVSPLRMFSLKFTEGLSFAKNKTRYIFLAAGLVCLAVFGFFAIPVVFLLYIALSAITHFMCRACVD